MEQEDGRDGPAPRGPASPGTGVPRHSLQPEPELGALTRGPPGPVVTEMALLLRESLSLKSGASLLSGGAEAYGPEAAHAPKGSCPGGHEEKQSPCSKPNRHQALWYQTQGGKGSLSFPSPRGLCPLLPGGTSLNLETFWLITRSWSPSSSAGKRCGRSC